MKPTDDTPKSRETARMLERAAGYRRSSEHKRDVIGGICASMASFIAAIDSDSRDVAAYIKQRLGTVLEHAPIDELEEVGQDARRLTERALQREEPTK